MIMIRAVVRPEKSGDVLGELLDAGYAGVTKEEVYGRGRQKGIVVGEVHYDEIQKELLIIIAEDKDKDDIVKIILKNAKTGAISTEANNHQLMVNARQEKIDKIAHSIPKQEVFGDVEDADLLIVGWGGTFGHLYMAFKELQKQGKKVALAHFQYINPLPLNTEEILRKYPKVVVAEQNLGQFASILRSKVPGVDFKQFNRVKGQPFNVGRLVEEFTKMMEGKENE